MRPDGVKPLAMEMVKQLLQNGHQCGACHNVSDVKVSMRKLFAEE